MSDSAILGEVAVAGAELPALPALPAAPQAELKHEAVPEAPVTEAPAVKEDANPVTGGADEEDYVPEVDDGLGDGLVLVPSSTRSPASN